MNAIWILIILVAILVIQIASKSKRYLVTADDYYVAYNIHEDRKSVIVWFIPVVAIDIFRSEVKPITSNEDYVHRIIDHPQSQDFRSYGHWIRNNQILGDRGIPDGDDTFISNIRGYIRGGYSLNFASSVPSTYSELVDQTFEQYRNEKSP